MNAISCGCSEENEIHKDQETESYFERAGPSDTEKETPVLISEPKTENHADTQTATISDSHADTQAEPQTETQEDTQADTLADTQAYTLADTQADTLADTQTEMETKCRHEDTQTETETGTQADTGDELDSCPVAMSRILECQGNSSRYYHLKDACDSEFLNAESQCMFACMPETDCTAFLTCLGGC